MGPKPDFPYACAQSQPHALHACRFFFLTRKHALRLPTPPQMHNKGNYVISLRFSISVHPVAG